MNVLPGAGALIQFDAQLEPGNSGGPLFDAATGMVNGIVTGKVKKSIGKQHRDFGTVHSPNRPEGHVRLNVEQVVAISAARGSCYIGADADSNAVTGSNSSMGCRRMRSGFEDFRQAFDAWSGSYNRYSEATRKTSSAASGATNQYGASVVGVYVALEIRAINSVIKDEEPKLARAQQQLEASGAHISKGGIDWYPGKSTVKKHAINWEAFKTLIETNVAVIKAPKPKKKR